MSAEADIYDYFTPVEDALATAFALNNVTCYTPLGEQILNEQADNATPDNKQQFQMKRPRVQAVLMPGLSLGRLKPKSTVRAASGFLREEARRCRLNLTLVTPANILEHRAYIARIQNLMDTIGTTLNASGKLPNHRIGGIKATGGDLAYRPQNGDFTSRLMYDVDLSVLAGAWAALGDSL